MPGAISAVIIGLFLLLQIIGEIAEAKGKVMPEVMKVRKYFHRKKSERQALRELPNKITEFNTTLSQFNTHYSPANIEKRNKWMQHINDKEAIYDKELVKLSNLLDRVNQTVIDIQIDNKRNQIIEFASIASNENVPVTREQFNRILKMYDDYERIIQENGMTNGEIEIAHSMIVKAYKRHMENHTFVEDYQDQ